MMQTIQCSYCGLEGSFAVHLKFEHARHHCGSCNHTRIDDWNDYFCNLTCLFNWLKVNEIEEKGYPCRCCVDYGNPDNKEHDPTAHLGSYKPTGKGGGVVENGVRIENPCSSCDGIMRIKETIHYNEKYEKIPAPYKNELSWWRRQAFTKTENSVYCEQPEPGNNS